MNIRIYRMEEKKKIDHLYQDAKLHDQILDQFLVMRVIGIEYRRMKRSLREVELLTGYTF